MTEQTLKINCPCCGQEIELFIEASGKIAARFYDIETDCNVAEILSNCNIELGTALGKEEE